MFLLRLCAMKINHRARLVQFDRHERTLLDAACFDFLPLKWKRFFAFVSDELDLVLHEADID